MKKLYKTKKYRTILFLLILSTIIIYSINIYKNYINNSENVYKENKKDEKIDIDTLIKRFKFSGIIENVQKINEDYYNVLIKDNEKYTSHILSIKDQKETNIISNKNDFLSKISKLMKEDYPDSIVDELLKSNIAYNFNENYLELIFSDYQFNSSRNYNYKIDYNDINDLLNFNILPKEPLIKNNLELDKSKVSISLTFDDGPNGDKTVRLIDALKDYNMSATFFVVGNKIAKNIDSLKYISNSNSEIGYHSYKHEYFTKQTKKEMQNDFNKSDNLLFENTGKHFKLTRPPYGSYNKDTLNNLNQVFVRWSVDTNDWKYKDADYLYKYVLDNYKDGDIILFHDSYESSIEAVIKLLDEFYKRDVQVLSVSKLAELKEIKLENNNIYARLKG